MAEPLKNMYNKAYLDDLAGALGDRYSPFDKEGFLAQILDEQWEERALKERMRQITLAIHGFLPGDYKEALGILRQATPQMDHYGFQNMVFPDFVELYGLQDWPASIPALEQFTQLVSAEFAVRPFIIQDQERMMGQMRTWAGHEQDTVRRLATEGCRPRLPWGIALPALQADPGPILPILAQLRNDPSESVRRSVANNLNDISKDHPETVVALLGDWQDEGNKEIAWITSHALRTLVKQGHPQALELLGFPADPALTVQGLAIEPDTLAIGEELTFSFEVISSGQEEQQLMIDYLVYLMRANGRQTPKVFKLSKRTLAPGQRIQLHKKHSFRPVTTRKYYPGVHALEIQINGQRFGRVVFELT